MFPVSLPWEALRHDICRHLGCWKIGGADSVTLTGISDKVISYPYVLRVLVELRVLC